MASLILTLLIAGQLVDSFNIRTVSFWPYSRLRKGYVDSPLPYCQVSESILYVFSGRGMYIFDVSNPGAVRKLDSLPTPGCGMWFSVSGNYLLTGQSKNGVALYDITDPRHPVLTSTYAPSWYVNESQLIGHYAFLIGNELRILDYSDPAHPVEVGSCPVPEKSDKVVVSGNYAYVCGNYYGFIIIDISDLTNPFEVFRYQIPPPPTAWPRDVQVRDTFAYIAWEDAGLRIWNVKDPTAPFEVGVFPGQTRHLEVIDTLAFVIRQRNNHNESLYILNVADPAQIRVLSRCRGDLAAVFGNRCYLVNPVSTGPYPTPDTITILDITDPASPIVLGRFSGFHSSTEGIAVQGNYVYTGIRGQGLQIFDVSDPTMPRLVSQIDSSWRVFRVWVSSDSIAYLACTNGPVLRIVDVSSPQNLVQIGLIHTTGNGLAITVRDTLAFLVCSTDVWILNVADPRSPQRIAVISSRATPWALALERNLLFIPYTYNGWGVRICDISDPARPESLSFFDTQCAVSDVAVSYPYAFVVGSQFIVLDISNPREPYEVARLSVPDYSWRIVLNRNLAYVAQAGEGVRIYDISDPYAPVEVGFYITPYWAGNLQVKDGLLYVADFQGWLILEYYGPGPGMAENRLGRLLSGFGYIQYQPATKSLRIKPAASKDEFESLKIFNASGVQIYAWNRTQLKERTALTLGPLDLTSGVYFAKLITAGKSGPTVYTAKFTVIK
ncbi:MAG: hypothetical protein ABIK23_02575 [candidate division WOR-3 bacterium]